MPTMKKKLMVMMATKITLVKSLLAALPPHSPQDSAKLIALNAWSTTTKTYPNLSGTSASTPPSTSSEMSANQGMTRACALLKDIATSLTPTATPKR